jgi:hypothetical protein
MEEFNVSERNKTVAKRRLRWTETDEAEMDAAVAHLQKADVIPVPRETLVDLTQGIQGIFLSGMGRLITAEDDQRIDRHLDARDAARKLLFR